MKHKHSVQWLQKYHPTRLSDIVGNIRVIRSLKEWIQNIQKLQLSNTQEQQQTQQKTTKHVPPITFLYGSGGIGKSCIAEVLLKHFNYSIYELSAGEIRSKKRIQNIFERILNNYSVVMMQSEQTQKTIGIIMDEVDGMSCGDKGGLHELFNIVKQNKLITHPIICISNRPYEKKISPELYQEFYLRFPTNTDIFKRLKYICGKENINIDDQCLHLIIQYGKSDIRRTIHFLQEVVYSSGDKQIEITLQDVQMNIDSSSQIHHDYNILSATYDIFNTPLSKQKQIQYYDNEQFLLSIMIYENIFEQLSQKKIKKPMFMNHYSSVLHHLCILDKVNVSNTRYNTSLHSNLCCGYTNHYISQYPTLVSMPKKIISANTLTKIAGQSCIYNALVYLSKQTRIHISLFHILIPLFIHYINLNISNMKTLNISFHYLEKMIQIYNKWYIDLPSSEKKKCIKITQQMKKSWKTKNK